VLVGGASSGLTVREGQGGGSTASRKAVRGLDGDPCVNERRGWLGDRRPDDAGAWYRCWRLSESTAASSTSPDDPANDEAFGRPVSSRGAAILPPIRLYPLVENGTHVNLRAPRWRCRTSEIRVAKSVLPSLQPGQLWLGLGLFRFGLGTMPAEQAPTPACRRVKCGQHVLIRTRTVLPAL